MTDPKRVIILTADAGFGHRRAANALAAALKETYGDRCQVEILNPMDDELTPALMRDSQTDYDHLVREMPEFYKLRYQISDAALPAAIMENAVTAMMYRTMQSYLRRYRPDVMVATHPMYPAPLAAAIDTSRTNTPFITVVTDLVDVHRMWFNDAAELIMLPTEEARRQGLQDFDLLASQLQVTGIPVDPLIVNEKRPAAEIRQAMGWRPDLWTVLVLGSKRVKNLDQSLHVLNHCGLPIQLIVVAGGDDELYANMQATQWHPPTHLYNFVENMAPMMRAADLIVCKAGGLTVTESLACGLPMLLIDVTPGQEEGNAHYVMKNRAAELAATPLDVLETLYHWLEHDGALLKEYADRALQLGRPQSAYTIADFIWAAAELGPLPVPDNRLKLLPKLREWLAQMGLSSEPAAEDDLRPARS